MEAGYQVLSLLQGRSGLVSHVRGYSRQGALPHGIVLLFLGRNDWHLCFSCFPEHYYISTSAISTQKP